ncbi:MAG: hypothetical protein ABW110_02015 [Steroidobacteraceae bacterium]
MLEKHELNEGSSTFRTVIIARLALIVGLGLLILAFSAIPICGYLAARHGHTLGRSGALALSAARTLISAVAVGLLVVAYSELARRLVQTRAFVFSISLLVLAAFAFFKWKAGVENPAYFTFVREDGPIETLGFIAFFGCAVLSFLTARRCWDVQLRTAAVFQLGLALFALFLGLEEINYGQRLFGFETPAAIVKDNYQESFNLHNMTNLEWLMDVLGPDLIIYWSMCGWLALALARRFVPSHLAGNLGFLAPPWHLTTFFLPYALWAYIDECCEERTITVWQDQEPAETYLAIAFLMFSIWAFRVATRASKPRQLSSRS